MVENCDTCACFPVCDRKFNMFGVFMGWADCNNWIPEVKHGKWIMRGGKFRCSECDEKALKKDIGGTGGFSYEYEQVKSNYCPNCGATLCKE